MDDGTSATSRTYEARIRIDEDGPFHHVAITGLGAFYVDGEIAAASHPAVKALRRWPGTPEWVVRQPEMPRGIDVQRPVPIELTWTKSAPWQPPKDWGSVPLASCREPLVLDAAWYDDEPTFYPALSAERIRAHYAAMTKGD